MKAVYEQEALSPGKGTFMLNNLMTERMNRMSRYPILGTAKQSWLELLEF